MLQIAPQLRRQALRLEYFTVGYNVLEGVVAVTLGIIAGSTVLLGFGLDSGVEVMSALVLFWRLTCPQGSSTEEEQLERRAILFVGISFFVLAAYVSWQAVAKLLSQEQPDSSWGGIVLAATSLLVMPWLARQKKLVAAQMSSRALAADANETLACSWLSAVLLGGLLLNTLFRWWWADPVASLGICYFLVKEGWEGVMVGTGREEIDGCAGDDDCEVEVESAHSLAELKQ